MASAGESPLPHLMTEDDPGSWSSNAALYRFVWAGKRDCLTQSALHAVPGRAALALWIGGLELRDYKENGSSVASPGDEGMLDWIVVYVRRGEPPKEVLTWMFPSFGGLLFDMALDASCSI